MTVVVGFVGDDGAVMGSDTEATEPGAGSRFDVEKIWTAGGLVLGYTGNDAVRQPLVVKIEKAVTEHFGDKAEIDRWEAREVLLQAIGPLLKHCYDHYVGGHRTPEGVPVELLGAVLVIGRDADGYWLLEINETNTPTFHTDHGFHGVGSGSSAAYVARSLMSDYAALGRTVAHLKLMAHRTVQACIDTLSGDAGVGGEVRLWLSQDGGAFAKAPPDEMQAIENGVAEWRSVERESLDAVVGQARDAPEGSEEVDLPDAIEDGDDTDEDPAYGDVFAAPPPEVPDSPSVPGSS